MLARVGIEAGANSRDAAGLHADGEAAHAVKLARADLSRRVGVAVPAAGRATGVLVRLALAIEAEGATCYVMVAGAPAIVEGLTIGVAVGEIPVRIIDTVREVCAERTGVAGGRDGICWGEEGEEQGHRDEHGE